MKISIRKETVAPMTAWLKAAREQGTRDEKALREILSMPDYGVEFQRYAEPNLPVCGISFCWVNQGVSDFAGFTDLR